MEVDLIMIQEALRGSVSRFPDVAGAENQEALKTAQGAAWEPGNRDPREIDSQGYGQRPRTKLRSSSTWLPERVGMGSGRRPSREPGNLNQEIEVQIRPEAV